MELFDAQTLVISTVLVVHMVGLIILAVAAAVLVMSLFAVVLAVHAVRTIWALAHNARRSGKGTEASLSPCLITAAEVASR